MQNKSNPGDTISIEMKPGAFMIMTKGFQENYTFSVPRDSSKIPCVIIHFMLCSKDYLSFNQTKFTALCTPFMNIPKHYGILSTKGLSKRDHDTPPNK